MNKQLETKFIDHVKKELSKLSEQPTDLENYVMLEMSFDGFYDDMSDEDHEEFLNASDSGHLAKLVDELNNDDSEVSCIFDDCV